VSRSDIVGWTLAEISLALLFAFLVLLIPAYARLNRKLNDSSKPDVAAELKNVVAENKVLKAEIEKSRRNLRSVATPSCAELGKASDWLFTATIRGSDSYDVGANRYTLAGLAQAYSHDIAEATRNGCRLRVKLYYGAEVSAAEYDAALRKIEQRFYDLKLGSER
jgi:hypothetical protein